MRTDCKCDDDDADLKAKYWRVGQGGYLRRNYKRAGKHSTAFFHRIVLERKIGRTLRSGEVTDHINGDPLDNRRSNLRVASYELNALNQTRLRRDNQSGARGVYLRPNGKWSTQVRENFRFKSLGTYSHFKDAARAVEEYVQARIASAIGEMAEL